MNGHKLVINYNIDKWNKRPYSTIDVHPQGVMQLYLDKVFQTHKTKAGKEKPLNVVHNRKILKFIIQAGSEENIEQLHEWLKKNSKVWLVEFQKLSDGRW